MKFATQLVKNDDPILALQQACEATLNQLQEQPDLALLFFSASFADRAEELAEEALQRLGTANILGVTAESLAGPREELELESGVVVWLAHLPNVQLEGMHLRLEQTSEGQQIIGWPDSLLNGWPSHPTLICLGDPFTFPADLMLERLNEQQPELQVVGGMASGGFAPGQSRLILGNQVHTSGAVAVLVSGEVEVSTVVSQGCRPIGEPMIVTKAEQNRIDELGGKSALLQLKAIFDTLPNHERELVQRGLHLGRVVSEYLERFEMGDFLIRNVMGVEPDRGSVVVGDYFRVGQTVQFHLRDEKTADLELDTLLGKAASRKHPVGGGLIFTCNGRGTRLFSEPHHDVQAITRHFPELPVGGFFAAGEFGPVTGKNFVHGFTASIALFHEPHS